ncbi:hypothetical protein VTN77DRAFT_578 [Rasamsonia byssochlamydoides]|uniref:uncharacterized protein n=1 Tax=Rasamsonia byssochlamydoides TaxID=89139 RepID=UPI0037431DEF
MPQQYGGSELGIAEAAVMMQTISESGGGMTAASSVHMNIFGLEPVVKFGTDEQKQRWLVPLIAGQERACFAVTEPSTELDTLKMQSVARRDGDDYVLSGQKIWISTAQHAQKILILVRTTPLNRPRASRYSTLISTRQSSQSPRSPRWVALWSTRTACSSTTGACLRVTWSVRRTRVSK